MFNKIQAAAIAALFATSALAYTPADGAPDFELVTVTVTNTKTYCPCDKATTTTTTSVTGLGEWGAWATVTSDGTTYTTKKTTSSEYTYTTTSASTSSYTTSKSTSYTTSESSTSYTTIESSTTTTASATPRPTRPAGTCQLVEWDPVNCQDDSYFKLDGKYLYQACDRTLVETENYLDDLIEPFCDASNIFDDSIRATAWDAANNRCYVYLEDDEIRPASYKDSQILSAGDYDYTIKFESNPCQYVESI